MRGVFNDLRIGNRGRVEADLVGTGIEQAAHIFHRAHTAAHRQGDEHLRSHGLDDVQDQVAPIAGSGDVQKGQFVGALFVVARRDFHRVSGIAQFHKVDTLDDPPACDVQAGNNSFSEHY